MTASRWAALLKSLGHAVRIENEYRGGRADILIALHAHRSHPSVARFRRDRPGRPVVVALTGTDIYGPARGTRATRRSLAMADRLVVLQPLAGRALPRAHRAKVRVIHQSALGTPGRPSVRDFEVCVVGHLRAVKDPFRAALAARLLPEGSRVKVLHIGSAMTKAMARRALLEQRRNPRYRWLGSLPRGETIRRLGRARVLVLSSRSEGGANVVSEAIAASVPVLASRVPGSVGLMGPRYPGYFPRGNTRVLARLLRRVEQNGTFHARLARHIEALKPLVDPAREREAWKHLLEELMAGSAPVRRRGPGAAPGAPPPFREA
ncbi:MAG TPA: selenoneine biosynthesis selenosugar synthase SenB [Candidatus Polarisedimenticolia bacterium]|nr:selenoneine biosynthesis selenosugar synthase SenB [Candidatus Polarisedimenticolia bacterium]